MLNSPHPAFGAINRPLPGGRAAFPGEGPDADAADHLGDLDLIIAPLFGETLDAIELIGRLGRTAYRGRVLFMAEALPDPGMVLAELQAAARPYRMTVELRQGRLA
ncbi:MAG: hypothetical protein ACK4GM_10525 [Tabrizicola sp.]